MPTTYCPQTGCGAKIAYEAVKPSVCPRCNRTFASAFKTAAAAPVIETRARREDLSDQIRPLTRSALEEARKKQSTTQVRPRAPRRTVDPDGAASHVMTPYNGSPADVPLPPSDDDQGHDDESFDRDDVHSLARELAASIDPSTITVNDDDDGVIRFSQFVDEARQNGGKLRD